MAEVRAAIDDIDRELVALLRRRLDFIEAAARIKPARALVRDEVRKAAVIANAVAEAERLNLPAALVEDLYERLVEFSIAHEFDRFDALNG